jgi:hypothetical protein
LQRSGYTSHIRLCDQCDTRAAYVESCNSQHDRRYSNFKPHCSVLFLLLLLIPSLPLLPSLLPYLTSIPSLLFLHSLLHKPFPASPTLLALPALGVPQTLCSRLRGPTSMFTTLPLRASLLPLCLPRPLSLLLCRKAPLPLT